MKIIVYSLPTIGLFLLAACGGKEVDKKERLAQLKAEQAKLTTEIRNLELEIEKEGNKDEVKTRSVDIAPVSAGKFVHYIEIQGTVMADLNVTVTAKMPGTLTKVLVQTGDEVKEGQVLAEMDKEAILKGIEEVKNQLTFATDVFNRQQKLWNQKIGSEVQYLTTKNNKESLEKRLESLKEQLDMALIKSPINGVIDEVFARVGQPAAPGVPTFRVVNFNELKARAEVAEVNSTKIRKGNKVLVLFPDIQDSLTATVNYASKVINPMTRTFYVEVPLPAGKQEYKPNSLAILKVADYANEKALTVPIRLIQNSEDGAYVLVAVQKGNQWVAEKRSITVGNSYNGIAEITSGLEIGDNLISVGYQSINIGDFLSINN